MLLHAGHGPALLRELVREHTDQVQCLVPAALRGLARRKGQGRKLRRPLPTSAREGTNGGDAAAGRVQVELRGAWSRLSLSDPPAAWRVWWRARRVWRPPGSLLASSSARTEENNISVHVDLDAVGCACRREEVVRAPIELERELVDGVPEILGCLRWKPPLGGMLPWVVVDLAPHEQHQHQHPERVHVGREAVDLASRIDFRCSVAIRTAEGFREGAVHVPSQFGLGDGVATSGVLLRQPEVRQLRVAIFVQDHVLELQVSEHDTPGVQMFQGQRHLRRQLQGSAQGKPRAPFG
mmetsp:Transcript_30414/g.87145  ORF Transcript_30414/g.87145 Transcript_30414/m.87145 type:complete len:295 (-) Transcript_30414:2124-3008(-)